MEQEKVGVRNRTAAIKKVIVVGDDFLTHQFFHQIDVAYPNLNIQKISSFNAAACKDADLLFYSNGSAQNLSRAKEMVASADDKTIVVGLGAPVESALGDQLSDYVSMTPKALNYVHGEMWSINGLLPISPFMLSEGATVQEKSVFFFCQGEASLKKKFYGQRASLHSPVNEGAMDIVVSFLKNTTVNPKKSSARIRDYMISATQLFPVLAASSWTRMQEVEIYAGKTGRMDHGNWIQCMTPTVMFSPERVATAAVALRHVLPSVQESFDDYMSTMKTMVLSCDFKDIAEMASGIKKPEKKIIVNPITKINFNKIEPGSAPLTALAGAIAGVTHRVIHMAYDRMPDQISIHHCACPQGMNSIWPALADSNAIANMIQKHPRSTVDLVDSFRQALDITMERVVKGDVEGLARSLASAQNVWKKVPALFVA